MITVAMVKTTTDRDNKQGEASRSTPAGRSGRGLAMRVSMADIARLADVSKPTVSRVLNGSPLVTDAMRKHVLAVAGKHGYAINRNAQKLRQTRTDTVQAVLDFGVHPGERVADPVMYDVLAGVTEALSVRNMDLVLSSPHEHDWHSYRDRIAARAVDGFLFLNQAQNEPMLRKLARRRIPFVAWGAVDPIGPYSSVGGDNRLGGELAGRHFQQRGCRRWMFIGDTRHADIGMRRDGLNGAAAQADAALTDLAGDDLSYAGVQRAMQDYLRGHTAPDAIFAFSDTAAMAAISAMREAGYVAPRDYALVGYNNTPIAADFTPAITTIEQETHMAGAILVEKLMQQIDGGRANSTVLPTRLIVRET